jgi:adenylylsulfate kinase-like enzyme
LDGDNIRLGLCSDLDFSAASCLEQSRRVSELALLFSEAGVITVCAVISPSAASRIAAKLRHQQRGLQFFEAIDVL